MGPLIQVLVALEMLLLPAWVAAVAVGPDRLGRRLLKSPAAVVLLTGVLLVLALLAAREPAGGPVDVTAPPERTASAPAEGPDEAGPPAEKGPGRTERLVVGVLEAQLVAFGFVVLLAGCAVAGQRLAGPRFGQVAAALVGYLVLGGIFLAGPAVELLEGRAEETFVRAAVHANPLVVAERALGFDWLHADLTYRHSPLGESRPVRWPAPWTTCLLHVFLGSALVVFSIPTGAKAGPGTAVPGP